MDTSDGLGSMFDSDTDDFEEMMSEIVYGAFREGIDVEGGWDISAEKSDSAPEFSMEIYRVKR